MTKCQENSCKSEATYGFKFAEPLYCKTHGLLNKASPQYQVCKCGASTPRFKEPADEKVTCCAKCKTDTMINAVDRRCKCKKHLPTYGIPTDTRAEYCSECKKEGMVNIKDKNRRCVCKRVIPSFGFPTDKKASCCVECKKEGMINLIIDLCSCGKSAFFGFKGDKNPTYCKACKKEGMENILSKKCKCGSAIPVFGKPSDKIPRYCQKCKSDEMINIVGKKCKCGKATPSLGFPDDTSPTCCTKCKTEGMINIISLKCKCGKQPVFGLLTDKKPSCCVECKTQQMVNIKAKMCVCGKSQPVFGFKDDKKAIHCASCKKDGMIDIISINCPSRNCKGTFELQQQGLKCPYDQRGKKKYDYYCTLCFQQNFPKDLRTALIRDKIYEMQVRDFLVETYKDNQFIHNKPLWTGDADCTCRRRIDFRSLIGNTLLCVEVDEDQHKYRDKNDEEIRYDDLMLVHGGKFIFIRINPNAYTINGKRMDDSMGHRLITLKKEIDKHIERINKEENKELVEIHQLYYDADVNT